MTLLMNKPGSGVFDQDPGRISADAPGERELRKLRDLFAAFLRGLPLIAGVSGLAAILVVGLTFLKDPKFTSVAKVMLDTRISADTELSTEVSGLPISLASLESELEVLRSTDLIETVVEQLSLTSDPEFSTLYDSTVAEDPIVVNALREETIKRVKDSTAIEQVGDASAVYAIEVKTQSPQKSADIANALAVAYLDVQRQTKMRTLAQSQGWLTTRITNLQRDIEALSSKLETHSINQPFSNDEYATIRARRITHERALTSLEDQLAELEDQAALFETATITGDLDGQREILLAAGLATTTPIAAPLDEAAILDLTTAFNERREALSQQTADLSETISTLTAQQTQQVQHEAQARRIENDILVVEAIYQDFVSQLSRRSEKDAFLDADAQIIESARPASSKSEPRRVSSGILGLLVAGVLATLFVLLRELLQTRLRSPFEYEDAAGLRLAAALPELDALPGPADLATTDSTALRHGLLNFGHKLKARLDLMRPAYGAAERVDRQRTAVSRNGQNGDMAVVIGGISTDSETGQTTALLALAHAFAKSGETVLYVDCDVAHSPFDTPIEITSQLQKKLLKSQRTVENLIVKSDAPNLSILPALVRTDEGDRARLDGTLLFDPAFGRMLQNLGHKYDRILLDIPPPTEVEGAAILLKDAHHIIAFARWNHAKRESVSAMNWALEEVGRSADEIVATRVDLKHFNQLGSSQPAYGMRPLRTSAS